MIQVTSMVRSNKGDLSPGKLTYLALNAKSPRILPCLLGTIRLKLEEITCALQILY